MPIMSEMDLINRSTSDQKPRAESLCLLVSRVPSFHQTSLCLLPPAFTWLPICLLALAPLVLCLWTHPCCSFTCLVPPSITKILSSVAASTSSLRGKGEDGKSAEFTAGKQDRDRDLPTPQVNSATLLPLFPTGEQARNVCSLFSGIFMESAPRGKKIKPVPYLTDTLVFTPPPGEGGLLKPCVTRLQKTNKYWVSHPTPQVTMCFSLPFLFPSVGPYIGRYCGQNTPGRIISYTGILALTINTDSAIAKEGFSANFTVIERTVPEGELAWKLRVSDRWGRHRGSRGA